jgi:DNA-3-methyladenine glycosylase
MKRFSLDFFAHDTLYLARNILGARLVRLYHGERLSGTIVETEAYIGSNDTACHASRGLTPRNAAMFGKAGYAYIYFVYGMHYMLNIVTEDAGVGAAVLLRALQPEEGIATMHTLRHAPPKQRSLRQLTSGPAKLTRALAIDKSFNQHNLIHGDILWLEMGKPIPDEQVQWGPRIGIDSAAEQDRLAPWRFWVADNPYISVGVSGRKPRNRGSIEDQTSYEP